MAVANSENPRLIREKLLAFLSPQDKAVKIREVERRRKAKFVETRQDG